MRLTRGERRALVHSAVLVVLAGIGRFALLPVSAGGASVGIGPAGGVDSALAVAESIRAGREARARPLAPGERVDLNRAALDELDRLPGVGPSLAGAIVRWREAEGPFRHLEQLEQVPGFGRTRVDRLAPHISLPVLGEGGEEPGPAAPTGSGDRHRINVNRASPEELMTLPGIGPAKAAAIIRWRARHGSIRSAEELLDVPGIGPVTLAQLRDRVEFGP